MQQLTTLVITLIALVSSISATVATAAGKHRPTDSLSSVASVAVRPLSASLTASATDQFTAIVRDEHGTIVTDHTVTWSSNDPAVATVSSSGVVLILKYLPIEDGNIDQRITGAWSSS